MQEVYMHGCLLEIVISGYFEFIGITVNIDAIDMSRMK